jgi:hypothetical protein
VKLILINVDSAIWKRKEEKNLTELSMIKYLLSSFDLILFCNLVVEVYLRGNTLVKNVRKISFAVHKI